MTSIHVNHGAMLALTTLSNINQNLLETQNSVSTGKEVSSSADDAAIWAVTTVMASDVDGFEAISSSLSLGKATLTVARNAAEKVTDLLRETKEKIVTAQADNVDREKIQTDIEELRKQVGSVVNAAQFNGLNLINGASEDPFLILSSLDRKSDGVAASHISVARQDLSFERTTEATFGAGDAILNPARMPDIRADNNGEYAFTVTAHGGSEATFEVSIGGETVRFNMDGADFGVNDVAGMRVAAFINGMGVEGISAEADSAGRVTVSNANSFSRADLEIKVINPGAGTWGINGAAAAGDVDTESATLEMSSEALEFTGRAVSEGDSYRVELARDVGNPAGVEDFTFEYVARDGDTLEDVAAGIRDQIKQQEGFDDLTFAIQTTGDDPTLGGVQLRIDLTGADITGADIAGFKGGTPGVGDGGLFALTEIDVSDRKESAKALENIEGLIQIGIDAAAAFGSSEKRVAHQSEFVKSLVDNFNSGISALADTDMEKASAKLQALQVQQQLATQSLSIANKAPQSLLGLFR